jgi:cytochrome c peroxidase
MRHISLAVALALLLAACGSGVDTPAPPLVPIPSDFPPLPIPADNPLTTDRIALGKRLFFDKALSRTGEISCGSCHLQEHAFADPNPVSIGVHGRTGTRNAPPLTNLAYNTSFFWDGGVPTLEQQAAAPIINPLEMDMSLGEIATRLAADPSYTDMFRRAYDTLPSPGTITRAIASFVRTMVSSNSRYDKFKHGDKSALNEQEQRGMALFFGEKADCFHCHIGFNFTNNSFRNNGLYTDYADSGRMRVTEDPGDMGKFKVPTLRNIALTAPYMHDGSIATLEEVVDHYINGGRPSANIDPLIHPLALTDEDKADLIAFLRSLTDEEFTHSAKFRP